MLEDIEYIPVNVKGTTKERLICTDYGEHCKYCHKPGCSQHMSLNWKALLIEANEHKITYYVERV
jgi:hypothetical protein